mmetsp:Transcript_95439/g.116854  ORF Transcript_95439/g.116854 Transcript_95439/m.116854 type:complete len:193 (+) Transcript_95439:44-622(+)
MGWGGCGKDWGAGAGGDWGCGGQDWSGGGYGCGKGYGGDGGCGKGFGGGGCGKGMGGMGMGMGGKGGMGGCGKGGGCGSNWGGCGVWQPMFNPMMMMKGFGKSGLRNFANDRKVFVGGMPPNNTSKEVNMKLKEHMSTAGVPCLYAEIGKSGTGGAAFKSNSEAMTAVAALNGSNFEGSILQVDMWGRKPTM